LIRCRLGLNPVAVEQWLTGWSSSVTCPILTGSYRCSCQRIAPPGLSTIDADPLVPVVVGPVFDPVVVTDWYCSCGSSSSSQSRGSGSSIFGSRSCCTWFWNRLPQYPWLADPVSVAQGSLQYLSILLGALLWLRYLSLAAPIVSVACRLQFLLRTVPAVSVAHSGSTVDPVALSPAAPAVSVAYLRRLQYQLLLRWPGCCSIDSSGGCCSTTSGSVAVVPVAPMLLIDSSGCRSSGSSGCCSIDSGGCRSIDSSGCRSCVRPAVLRSTPVAVVTFDRLRWLSCVAPVLSIDSSGCRSSGFSGCCSIDSGGCRNRLRWMSLLRWLHCVIDCRGCRSRLQCLSLAAPVSVAPVAPVSVV